MPGIFDIDLKPTGIAKVLNNNRLRVPPYQRPYAWKDEHVNQLFDDLSDAFQTSGQHYFLGTIVLNKTSEVDLYEVSDGQQRLATTAILIAAIRDQLEGGTQTEKTTAEKYTRNFLIEFEELQGDWTPRLQLNTQDTIYFRQQILVPPSQREKTYESKIGSNDRLGKAYNLAKMRVNKLMAAVSTQMRTKLLYEWINFLNNKVAVVQIIVPDDIDGYTMFETLNDRGLRASQVDNIKNRLFKQAGSRLDEVENLWLSMMSQIESFGGDDIVVSYLRHYWISENGPTRETELAKKFRDHIRGQVSVASFIQKLDVSVADYEALFYSPLEHPRLDKYTANTRGYINAITKVLGIEQIRPLLLAIARAFDVVEAEKAFQLMLSWSVRFLLAGTGGGGLLDRAYGVLAAKVSKGEINSARALRDDLSSTVPNDVAFQAAFRSRAVTNSEIARYLCRSIEAHKRVEPNPAVAYFENTSSANLEHILPRTPGKNWNVSTDVAKAYYKRIGNITLLPPKINVDLGNSDFEVKKLEYLKSQFLITQEIANCNNWGPEEIEERQKEFAVLAPLVWPLTWKK